LDFSPTALAAEYGLLTFCLLVSAVSFAQGRTGHAVWALVNAMVFVHIVVNLLWDEAPVNE
jgi:hypothetical protein